MAPSSLWIALMIVIGICPAAVSEPTPEDANVKCPPNSGERTLDATPSFPIQKQTSLVAPACWLRKVRQ